MKTRSKTLKLLSVLLSLALIMTALPFAFAADEYDKAGATKFVFSDAGIKAEKGKYSGYKIEGTALSIKDAGTYILSGLCADGSVNVKKGVKGVTLVLNGLILTSADTAPLTCSKSSEVTVIAEAGSVNTLTDSAYNNDDVNPDNENAENAVIKCKDGSQVVLCGTGTINVVSKGKNGIKSGATTETEGEASFTVKDVTLNVTADVNDGFNVEQTLNIESGTITVSAADDGIHSDLVLNIGKEGTDGPVIRVNKSYEGLEGSTITVYSGDIEVHSSDDGINAANSDLSKYDFSMTFAGGKTVVYADNGDGLDSNGTINVSGGSLTVWTKNKADNSALDSDNGIYITGGTVLAAGGSGGMGMKLNATQPCLVFGATRMNFGGMIFGGGMKPGAKDETSVSRAGLLGGDNLSIKTGETITIKDMSGNTLCSAEAPYDINSIVFSSAELTEGESYCVFAGESEKATSTARTGNNISSSSSCRCMCHMDGIFGYIWNNLLVKVFKLLNISQTCRCGKAHY